MENNTLSGYDPSCKNDSLGTAIRTVAYPFDTLQEKIDLLTDKFNNNFFISDPELSMEKKIEYFKAHFRPYYADKATYNFYGLTVIEPF